MTKVPPNLHKPHDNHTWWLLRRIWDRVNRHNEHFMGVIVGREGSGKSHTALRICSELDPSFNADRVLFDVVDLLEILKDGEHEPGNFYALDEAGVQLGRRTWQERSQVLANQALQLVRNHNLGLIFTLPRLSELDSQTEGRLQAFYELIDKEPDEYVVGKWKWIDPDRANMTGKIYKKYPKRRINNHVRRITRISFRPPNPSIIEPYEAKKTEFQEQFYEKTIQKFREEDGETEEEESFSPKELAEKIASNGVDEVVAINGNTGESYISKDLIRAEYGLSHADANAVKSIIDRDYADSITLSEDNDQDHPNKVVKHA